MESRTEFWVSLEEHSDDERAEACRSVLEAVAPSVVLGAVDLPMTASHGWPPTVLAAAERIRDYGVKESERNDTYMVTEFMPMTDPDVWHDFIAVAPYAYYADVWDEEGAVYAVTGG